MVLLCPTCAQVSGNRKRLRLSWGCASARYQEWRKKQGMVKVMNHRNKAGKETVKRDRIKRAVS
jgi:hypothetical protein